MRKPKKPATRRTRKPKAPVAATSAQEMQQAPIDISTQQIQQSAAAGVKFLSLETTLVPGNMRKQLAVLEVVLQGVVGGNLMVVSPKQIPVESKTPPA